MLCPHALIPTLGAEDLGLGCRWDTSTKQMDIHQFFTRPDFALGLVLARWPGASAIR